MSKKFGCLPTVLMKQSKLDFEINRLIFNEFIQQDIKYEAQLAGAKIK